MTDTSFTRLAPLLVLAVGLALLAFTVTTESEPGALPLLVTVVGAGWCLVARRSRAQ